MFIDRYLNSYSFFEKHQIVIRANSAKIWNTIYHLKISDICSIVTSKSHQENLFINVIKSKFILLEESENEVLLGLVGKFWRNKIVKVDKEEFKKFNKPGYAKLIWNISIEKIGKDKNILKTETRIECKDNYSMKMFGLYWFFIKPFSGLTRIYILKKIKNKVANYDKNNISY